MEESANLPAPEIIAADLEAALEQFAAIAEDLITDIHATAIDYDVTAKATQRFFATVQNKLHWAIHGQTAAEVIVSRADASKDAPKGKIQKFDVSVAKRFP